MKNRTENNLIFEEFVNARRESIYSIQHKEQCAAKIIQAFGTFSSLPIQQQELIADCIGALLDRETYSIRELNAILK